MEWKVTVDGDFQPGHGKACREISLRKQFAWGDELWHIPALYLCSGGLVIDFCVEVSTERMRAFYEKVKPIEEQCIRLTEDEELLLRSENPLKIGFRPEIILNGEVLRNKRSVSQAWISSDIAEDFRENQDGLLILEHYKLDISKAWMMRRCIFPWEEKRDVKLQTLEIRLVRDKTEIPGVHFHTPAVGDDVKFIHPFTGVGHSLAVREYEKQEMDENHFHNGDLEFPRHFAAMTYTIYPDLPDDTFMLRDCDSGDCPRPKHPDSRGRYAVSAGAIAWIHSNDGPMQVCYVNGEPVKPRVVCSSLHFEPLKAPVEWRLVFREKLMDDLEITLI